MGAEYHANRQVDMTRVIVAARHFANPPKQEAMCGCIYIIITWYLGLNHSLDFYKICTYMEGFRYVSLL